mgnify:CR=1 FL=1
MIDYLVILKACFSDDHAVVMPVLVTAEDKQAAYNIAASLLNDELPGVAHEFISVHLVKDIPVLKGE